MIKATITQADGSTVDLFDQSYTDEAVATALASHAAVQGVSLEELQKTEADAQAAAAAEATVVADTTADVTADLPAVEPVVVAPVTTP